MEVLLVMTQLLAPLLCGCLLLGSLTGCVSPTPEIIPPPDLSDVSGVPQPPPDLSQPDVSVPDGSGSDGPLFPIETPIERYPDGQAHKVTLLMYHHLTERPEEAEDNSMVVTAQRFAEDLDWLQENGYTTVLPRELVEGEPLPDKAVLITLDDGYRSNYTLAFPLLQERGMKAAIALICGKVDAQDPFYLTWDMCREMLRSGLVEFGSHSYWLHNLDERNGSYVKGQPNGIQRLDGEDLEAFQSRVLDDLERSAQRIQDELNTQVLFLAYPYGVKEPWASDFIAQRFAMTFRTKEGVANLTKGFYSLPRKTVSMDRKIQKCF